MQIGSGSSLLSSVASIFSGTGQFTWANALMMIIGGVLIYLAVRISRGRS